MGRDDALTFALHPCLDGDAGKDDGGAEPLAGRERVVVDDDGEQHREELPRQRDRAVGRQSRGQSVSHALFQPKPKRARQPGREAEHREGTYTSVSEPSRFEPWMFR